MTVSEGELIELNISRRALPERLWERCRQNGTLQSAHVRGAAHPWSLVACRIQGLGCSQLALPAYARMHVEPQSSLHELLLFTSNPDVRNNRPLMTRMPPQQ